METLSKSELIIENVGCGRFQVIHFVCVGILLLAGITFTNQFMSFGNYNPGWRCLDQFNEAISLDNITRNASDVFDNETRLNMAGLAINASVKTMLMKNNVTKEQEYSLGDCSLFESCKNVEFNPEASTIVTEWGLVCGDAWISSFIISLQMIGFLIGSVFAGISADAYGRKFIIYLSVAFILILNIISIFSTSWQMFGALRLLLGISMSFAAALYFVYVAEFVTIKWRAIVMVLPIYSFLACLFGITCFLIKDWRLIHIVTCVISAISLTPVFWLPRSLRWLEVKQRTTEFHRSAQKIAKCNRKTLPELEQLKGKAKIETNKETIIDMFRNIRQLFRKEYRKYTIIVTVPWFSVSLLYYAITFGVKALSGNFYMNLIIFYGIELVVNGFLVFVPDLLGRKKAGILFSGFSGFGLLMAACFQELGSGNVKIYGVAALVMCARMAIEAFWNVMRVFMVELYPTVIRASANSWGLIIARIGGIIAPILIPNEAGTVFICYSVMGVLAIVCAILVLFLPETKNKVLRQGIEERNNDGNDNGDALA